MIYDVRNRHTLCFLMHCVYETLKMGWTVDCWRSRPAIKYIITGLQSAAVGKGLQKQHIPRRKEDIRVNFLRGIYCECWSLCGWRWNEMKAELTASKVNKQEDARQRRSLISKSNQWPHRWWELQATARWSCDSSIKNTHHNCNEAERKLIRKTSFVCAPTEAQTLPVQSQSAAIHSLSQSLANPGRCWMKTHLPLY